MVLRIGSGDGAPLALTDVQPGRSRPVTARQFAEIHLTELVRVLPDVRVTIYDHAYNSVAFGGRQESKEIDGIVQ